MDSVESSPRTRLANGVSGIVPQTTADSGLNPRTQSVSQAGGMNAASAVAMKAPTTRDRYQGVQQASLETDGEPVADKVPAEYADLVEAFRGSSPEVQQQAMRQLLAVGQRGVANSGSPKNINGALRASMASLPALPEDPPAAAVLPTRLAQKQSQPETDSDDVVTASLNSSDEETIAKVQLANNENVDRPAPIADVANGAGIAGGIGSATETQLYNELLRRLKSTPPGGSDADQYRAQIIARHLMLFSGNPDGAVESLEGMSLTEQEFLRHHLLGVWSMVDSSGHPVASRRWSSALPEFRLATQKLSAATESLQVGSLALCREIQSFGQVTKFDSDRFTPGQKVILYCEIDNFVAKSTPAGFETNLQGSYEVFNAKNQKVAGQVLPADKQVCANYLRDYFIAYQMNLPSGLEPGDYRLELTMECITGEKYGQASLPLRITANSK